MKAIPTKSVYEKIGSVPWRVALRRLAGNAVFIGSPFSFHSFHNKNQDGETGYVMIRVSRKKNAAWFPCRFWEEVKRLAMHDGTDLYAGTTSLAYENNFVMILYDQPVFCDSEEAAMMTWQASRAVERIKMNSCIANDHSEYMELVALCNKDIAADSSHLESLYKIAASVN